MKRAFIRKIQVLAIALSLVVALHIFYENKTEKTTYVTPNEVKKEILEPYLDKWVEYTPPFGLSKWFDGVFYLAYFVIASGAIIVVTNNFKQK
jgi:hypothetical protein